MPIASIPAKGFDQPLLAIDTSSAQGSIALYDGHLVTYRSWSAERTHTTTLLAEIHQLLESASVDAGDVAAIGIAVGPGAFTGLRAGFGVAKGFHLALGIPLIGISTLEATALPFAICGLPIVAVIGAGRGRLAWALYESGENSVRETRAAKNGTAEELTSELQDFKRIVVVGELDGDQARAISELEAAVMPPRALRNRHPAALAELAWRRFRLDQFDDAATLEPVYLSR